MADLVKAKESYWAGEHMIGAGTVLPADDPRVRAPHVEAFDPAPTVEPESPLDPPKPPARQARR